jgi:preprotein translocase subunit SecG
MAFLIGLLTVIMVLDCAVLILLVLIQLPKKESGAGLAFGGGATDALFGAGSGNVLTRITTYSATIFFVLALVVTAMFNFYHNKTTSQFEQELQNARPAANAVAPAAQQQTPAATRQAPAATPITPDAPATAPSAPVTPAPAPAPAPAK